MGYQGHVLGFPSGQLVACAARWVEGGKMGVLLLNLEGMRGWLGLGLVTG